ncbi:MAG: hypothetical protein ACRDSF_17050 [Pseudonocardiaceae bacterium]
MAPLVALTVCTTISVAAASSPRRPPRAAHRLRIRRHLEPGGTAVRAANPDLV